MSKHDFASLSNHMYSIGWRFLFSGFSFTYKGKPYMVGVASLEQAHIKNVGGRWN